MLSQHSVLIVEDEVLTAMNLATEIETLNGYVVGPVGAVADALAILDVQKVTAAILDANLTDRNVTPVALFLASRGVPFVLYSGLGIPDELAFALPSLRLVPKPAQPYTVIAQLRAAIADCARPAKGVADGVVGSFDT